MGASAAEIANGELMLKHFTIYNEMLIREFEDRRLGEESRLVVSYLELITAHIMYKSWAEAERCGKMALEEAAKFADPLKSLNMRTLPLTNLGMVYILTKRYGEAEELLQTALSERETLYGPNDRVNMMYVFSFY